MWCNRIVRSSASNGRVVSLSQQVVRFSSKKKDRAKAFAMKQQQRVQMQTEGDDLSKPDFNSILRQLYRRSHPDLLRHSHPTYSEHNDSSMQVLNGVLSTIKTSEYPPQIIKDITFYMKSTVAGSTVTEVQPFVLSIRTGGGDCRRQLTTTFEQFFTNAGLSADGKFHWNKEYFPIAVENSGKETTVTEVD